MSFPPETFSLLGNVPLFAGLSNDLLARHLGHSRRLLAAGKTLRSLDGPANSIYIILSGCLRERTADMGSGPVLSFGAGEAVSEISIPGKDDAFDLLTASTDCELLCLEPEVVLSLASASPHAAGNMLNLLAAGITASRRGGHDIENEQGYAGLDFVDELTGLYNVNWMTRTFERQIYRAVLNKSSAVLMLASINQFEDYNKSHGSLGGDQALRSIAQTILTCLRPDDQAVHYYGEIFAVFIPHTSLKEAQVARQRLKLQASKAVIVTPTGDALPNVTLSIGLAEVQEGRSLQQLIEKAAADMQQTG